MRIFMKTLCLASLSSLFISGCQTARNADEASSALGCAPANRDPAVSWQVTGHPNYVTPGCEPGATTAQADGAASAEEKVAAGAEALPPMAEESPAGASSTSQNGDIVEGKGGTPCGLTVVALSAGAVGDPCMTTEGVIESLGLNKRQREYALAGVARARELFTNVAH